MRHHGSLAVIEKVCVKAKGTIGSCMMVEPANCKTKGKTINDYKFSF
jgi:hypothetical protein